MSCSFNKTKKHLLLLVAISLFLNPAFSFAQINPQINYQGKLTNPSGVAVPDGLYNMRFWLLESDVISTTSSMWDESLTGGNQVQVTNGLFSVMLGEQSTLSGVDFNQTLYLGVEIGGTSTPAWDGEMSPRKILGAVPVAFYASTTDSFSGLATTSFLRSDQTDTALGLLTFSGGLLSTASSTITNLTTSIATTTTFVINNQAFTNFLGTGLINDNGILTVSTSSLADLDAATLNGEMPAYYLSRANHTGTQLASTISDFSATARGLLSSTAVGLTYTSGTGVFSLTSGHNVPLTASSTNWNNFYNTPSTRVAAGTKLSWSGNTLDVADAAIGDSITSATAGSLLFAGASGVLAQDNANIFWDDTNNRLGIGTTTPNNAIQVAGLINFNDATFSTSIGRDAGISLNTTGNLYNTAVGMEALFTTVSGVQNVAIGFGALRANTNSNNTAVGYNALRANTSGNNSVAVGAEALLNNTTGLQNTAVGYRAMQLNISGTNNAAFGDRSLQNNTSGGNNAALGLFALQGNTTGGNNTAVGLQAGVDNTTGSNNTYIGFNSGRFITSGSNNTIIGANVSGLGGALANNIIIADGSGNRRINVNDVGNVGIGTTTPTAVLHLRAGTAAANSAPLKLTSGTLNTTAEVGAIEFLNDAFYGTITTGAARKQFAFTDLAQTFTGIQTFGNASSTNLTVATNAYLSTVRSGVWNGTAIGEIYGGTNQSSYTIGDMLYASGSNTLTKRVIGTTGQILSVSGGLPVWSSTSTLGLSAEFTTSAQLATILSDEVGSGALVFANNSTLTGTTIFTNINVSNNVGIGTTTPARALHVQIMTDDAPVRFQDSNGYCEINPTSTTWTCTSDKRLKENIESLDSQSILTNLAKLRPVSFSWISDGSSGERFGLIAQEVEEVFPDLVTTDLSTGYKSVAYGGLTPYLISGLQEVSLQVSSTTDSLVSLLAQGTVSLETSSPFYVLTNGEEDTVWERLVNLAKNFVDGVLTIAGLRTDELCVGDVCIDEEIFLRMVEQTRTSLTPDDFSSIPEGGGSEIILPPPDESGTTTPIVVIDEEEANTEPAPVPESIIP